MSFYKRSNVHLAILNSHVRQYSLQNKRDIKQNQKLSSPVNKSVQCPGSSAQSPESSVQSSASRVQRSASRVQRLTLASRVQEFQYVVFLLDIIKVYNEKVMSCYFVLLIVTFTNSYPLNSFVGKLRSSQRKLSHQYRCNMQLKGAK